jgi:hypothetical protein
VVSNSNVGITGNDARTLECWVKVVPTDVFNEHIINWGDVVDGTSFGFYQSNQNQQFELIFFGHGHLSGFDYPTGFTFDGNWHHIAVTYNGTHVRTYVDGSETAVSNQAISLNTTNSPLFLGVRQDLLDVAPDFSTYSNLQMDEVRIWERALSIDEIRENKDCELSGFEDDLVLYYNFNRGTPGGSNGGVSTLPDLAGGNTGSLRNFALSGSNSNWVNGSPVTQPCCEAADQPTLSASKTSICVGESVTISITSGDLKQNSDWVWYAGADISSCGIDELDGSVTSITVNPTSTTFYSVRGEGGCAATSGDCAGINIIVNPAPTASATSNSPICEGASLELKVSSSGATGYSWTGPNGFSSNAQNPTLNNVTSANTGTYTVEVNNNGCVASDQVEVTVNIAEPIAIEVENSACGGSPLNLATSETIENIVRHRWSGPNNFSSGLTFPTINNASNLNSGTYSVSVTYETGCTVTASRNITISPNPTFELNSNDPTCVGENLNIQVNNEVEGGMYSWTGPNNFTSSNETVNINNLSTTNAGTYELTYTTGANCSATNAVTVSLSTLPEPNFSTSGDFCGGDASLVLQDNGNINYEYRWLNQNSGKTYNGKVVTINNPQASDAGVYSVSVTNSAGCEVVETINVNFKGNTPQLEIIGDNSVCSGSSIQLAAKNGSGQNHVWTGPNNLEETGANLRINNVNSQNAGLYTLTADNGNGCSVNTSINVRIDSSPNVTLTANNSTPCEGETLTLSETNGDLVAWSWTGPNNFTSNQPNPSITNLSLAASGTYKLVGRNAQGCETESTLEITVNSSFDAGTGLNRDLCAGPVINLNELLNGADADGVFMDDNGTGSLNGSLLATENLTPGLYFFTYAAPSNSICNTTSRVAITIRAIPTPVIEFPTSFCLGTPNLTLTDASAENYNYNWTHQISGTTYSDKSVIIENPTENVAGAYTVEVTNEAGCIVKEDFNITYNGNPPPLSITGEQEACAGETIQLMEIGTEGQNHIWTGPNNFTASGSTINLENLAINNGGIYTVRAENANGCTAETSINITVNPLPNIEIGNDTTLCAGTDIQLSELGGDLVNWTWTGPNGFNSNEQHPNISKITVAGSGNYALMGTDDKGCTASSSLDLIVNPSFNAGSSRDLQVCKGSQVDLTILIEDADQGGIFFDESGAGTLTGNILETAGLAEGDYIFSYSLAETSVCISSTSFFIRVQDQLNAGEDLNLSICQNEPLDLSTILSSSASVGGEFLDIGESGALTGSQFDGSVLSPANYNIIYRVGEGSVCPLDEATISINLNPVPAKPNLQDAAICEGESFSLSATDGVNYAWTNGATTQTIVVTPNSTTTYGVTVSNDFNCTNSGEATIMVNKLPELIVSPDGSICEGNNFQLTASGATTYTWSPSIGLDNTNNPNPIASPAMTTSYEVIGTSEEGCTSKQSVTVEVNQNPILTTNENTAFCLGTGTTLSAMGQGTIQWIPATGLDNPNSATPFANPTTTTDYQAILTDANGCTDTGAVQVVVEALPNLDLGPDQTICEGDDLELIASGGGTYLWTSTDMLNDPTSISQMVSPKVTSTYLVMVVGENNCEATDEITIMVNEIPTANAGADQITCNGVGATLIGSGGGTYEWSNGATDAAIMVQPKETTIYTLVVTNELGCKDTDEVLVSLRPEFMVEVSADTFFCLGESTQLAAMGGANYTWSPSIGLDNPTIANPIANPISTTNYTVEIKDDMGCIVNREVMIEVKQVENFSLSPNQDVCEGNSINLEVSGGQIYNWFPNNAFADPSLAIQEVRPLQDATYRVEVEDEFGCKIRDSVQVTIRPIPIVTVEAPKEICEGENLDLVGNGTDILEWKWEGIGFNATEQNTQVPNILPNQSGQFKLIATTEYGCSNADSLEVIVNPLPVAIIDAPEQLCENTALILRSDNTDPNLQHTWTREDGTTFVGATWELGPAQLSFSGNYLLEIIDEKGCTNQTMKQVEVMMTPQAGLDTTFNSCQGSLVNLRELLREADETGIFELGAGLPDLDNNVLNTQTVEEGTYVINYQVEQATCPTAIAALTLRIDTPKKAGLDNNITVCQGIDVNLNELLQEADAGGIYQPLSNADALATNIWQTNQLTPNTYQINYVQTNACGSDEAQLSVAVLEQVKAGEDIMTDLCKGGAFELKDLLISATEGGTFEDFSQTNTLQGSQWATEDLPIGAYAFAYHVGSNNECPSDTAQININLKEILTAGLDNEVSFCSGPTINLKELLVEADNGGEFIAMGMTPPTLMGDAFESANLDNNTYTFEYKVGGTAGCPEDVALISATINQSPNLEWSIPNNFLCIGDTLLLEVMSADGTGDLQFEWQTPKGVLTGNQIMATQAGDYLVKVTNEANCFAELDTAISSNAIIDLSIEGRTEICQNEDLNLQASETSEILNYRWLLPNGTQVDGSTLTIEGNQIVSGNYQLQYTDQFNCQQVADTMITLSPGAYFKSNFLTTNTVCMGDSLQLIEISEVQLSPSATYEWNFGDGQSSQVRDPAHVFQSIGLFPISVKINDQDCGSESIVKEVKVVACRQLPGFGLKFKNLNLYPNPTFSETNLIIEMEKPEAILMRITDIYGRLVQENYLPPTPIINEQLFFSEPGMYFIQLKTIGEQHTLKLIVE